MRPRLQLQLASSMAILCFQISGFAQDSENAQFQYVYLDELTPSVANARLDYLEANYERVMRDLGIDHMPLVTVYQYADYESLYKAQEELTIRSYRGSGGFVYWTPDSDPQIHLMFDMRYADNHQHTTGLLHEFAHLVTGAVNPSISNNPRWLWETVAIYESLERSPNLKQHDYLLSGDYPSIRELNMGYDDAMKTRNIYHFGYVIGEYIVNEWGLQGLISLVESNGDIPNSLGISESEFDSGWHGFMQENYLDN